MIELFVSMHVFLLLFFCLTHDPTYKTNVLASMYVEQTFMFNVLCNVYYYKNSNCLCLLSVY